MPELEAAAEHTDKALAKARDLIGKVLKRKVVFPSLIVGSIKRKREGADRRIHYIEVEDGSGQTLRIEVFVTKEAALPLAAEA